MEIFLEKFHGLDEATLSRGHDQVDGVEVFLTIKAACQIGFRMGGGVEAVAGWTLKAKQRIFLA